MATIKIQRTSEYNNRMRNYQIFIDGQKTGIIANGQTMEFTTSPGQHTIMAKIDWCSSPDLLIHINDNETKNLKVGSFKHANWIMPIGAGIIALHFILKMTMGFNYVLFLVFPVSLILLYYITFGRKKFLTLTEIN